MFFISGASLFVVGLVVSAVESMVGSRGYAGSGHERSGSDEPRRNTLEKDTDSIIYINKKRNKARRTVLLMRGSPVEMYTYPTSSSSRQLQTFDLLRTEICQSCRFDRKAERLAVICVQEKKVQKYKSTVPKHRHLTTFQLCIIDD